MRKKEETDGEVVSERNLFICNDAPTQSKMADRQVLISHPSILSEHSNTTCLNHPLTQTLSI